MVSAEIVLFDWVIFTLQMREVYYNTRHMLSETDIPQVAKYSQVYWYELICHLWIESHHLKRSPHFHSPFWHRMKQTLIAEVHRQPVFKWQVY